jgi:superfamily II DNA or RNA helicase
MINDITNFLFSYPNIYNYVEDENNFLNPYTDDFNSVIFEKKEFYDDRLEKTEKKSDIKGEPLKHQKIISKFLSSRTHYDQLLLLHQMGTGKTCAAIMTIEQIKKEKSNFTGALVFARGPGLINNFKNELVNECTKGDYKPEKYDTLTEGEKVTRTNKLISEYYTFYTFFEFAKELSKITNDNVITELYSNKIIVIDEVHNIRFKEEKDGDKVYVYNEFNRFLHLVRNYAVPYSLLLIHILQISLCLYYGKILS